MFSCFFRRCALIVLASLIAASSAADDAVPLFDAIDDGRIAVKVIPRDTEQLMIQFENPRDVPLTIRLPDAIAAVPVLAQQQPLNFNNLLGGPVGGQGANNQAQGLGAPLGGPGGGNNNLFPGGPVFNVPPGKIIKKKIPCLCLEFGKPDPQPRIPYEIKPLAELNDDPRVRQLLQVYGQGRIDNTTAQIAAWHLANEMSWEQLAALTHERATGQKRRRYSASQIALAQRVVEALPGDKTEKTSPGDQVSSR